MSTKQDTCKALTIINLHGICDSKHSDQTQKIDILTHQEIIIEPSSYTTHTLIMAGTNLFLQVSKVLPVSFWGCHSIFTNHLRMSLCNESQNF
jgi:hypothetical protein